MCINKSLLGIIVINFSVLNTISVFAAALIAGPPTYSTSSSLIEDRGAVNDVLRAIHGRQTGYKSNSGATAAIKSFPEGGGTLPSGAIGIASDTQLKSLARAAGRLANPDPNVPFVEARNLSVTTRYFSFSSSQSTVPLDFFASVDGTLISAYLAEIIADVHSQVRFGLDVVDLNNTVIAPVFEVMAINQWTGPGTFSLSTTTSGAADLADWQAAIDDLGVPPGATPAGGRVFGVDYAKLLRNAYQAPVDRVLGFRWFLETEATVSGGFDFGTAALVEADFYNTANIDIALNDNAAVDASFSEILVTPVVVPLPATAPLVLTGCGVLIGLARKYAQR